jgi:hypothetical protein
MVENLKQYEEIIRGFLKSRSVARTKEAKNKVSYGTDRVSFLGVLHVSMCSRPCCTMWVRNLVGAVLHGFCLIC